MPIYLQIPGIQGKVSKAPYTGWIQLQSMHFAQDRKEIDATKVTDSISGALMQLMLKGPPKKMTIALTKGSGPDEREYMRIELTEALVSNFSPGGKGKGDRPMESLSLNYAELSVSYTRFDPTEDDYPSLSEGGWNQPYGPSY